MRLLLDTHVFLWWNMDDPRLTASARAAISDPANDIFLSGASAWEIAVKWQKGRLVLPDPPQIYVPSRMTSNAIFPLPIGIHHATHVTLLPALHADPFDRLLVSQAQLENMFLVSADQEIARYDVRTIW